MKRLLLLSLLLLLLSIGCKKGIKNTSPQNPPDTTGTIVNTMNIHIEIPQGSTFNPSGGQVMSAAQFSNIDSKGNVDAFAFPQDTTLAYVFNKEDNLMMMGFISGDAKVISPASTAKVLLYWGLDLPFYEAAYKKSYLSQVNKDPMVAEWVAKFEELFKSDPFVVSKGGFTNELKKTLEKLQSRNKLDIKAKAASDIKVDANDIRSGLRVQEDGLSQYSVNNHYRRRAYAYLYKMNYKDLDNNPHQVLSKIIESSSPDNEFEVGSRAAVTSVTGEVGKWIESSSQSSFVVKSGPNDLQLADNESEAIYKIRIIGPGQHIGLITENESAKLVNLEMETFVFDVVIPGISMVMSVKGAVGKEQPDPTSKEKLLKFFKEQYKAIPDLYEEIKKGNYKNAYSKLMENIYKDALGVANNQLLKIIGEMYKTNPGKLLEGATKLNAIMAAFDIVLSVTDITFVLTDIAKSHSMEEWDITARSSKVSLLPAQSATVPGGFVKLEATIKNLGTTGDTHPFFEWRTTGKYGELRDSKGHKGVSFESDDAKPQYYCSASSAALSDGDNLETVYVKAYMGSNVIGTDTITINVKKFSYKITPDGITLSGKENQANEAVLYLVRSDGKSDIGKDGNFDYKVVWETEGKYGKLTTSGFNGNTALTTYNYDHITYVCTDNETKEAKEEIKARIYMKEKSDGDEWYHLVNEAKVTVNLNNDDKKRILHIPLEIAHSDVPNTGLVYWCYKYLVATFPEDKDAKSYNLKFIGVPVVIGAPSGDSWSAGKAPYWSPPDYVRPGYDGSNYTVYYSYTHGGTTTGQHVPDGEVAGMAEVIITLK